MTSENRCKHMPKVSVVMPAYNAAQYIEEAIQSVIGQTCTDWELIIVDDHSTDHTKAIVQRYCDMDIRIRLVPLEKNAGVANARNVGISEAQGEWIALLDSDDIWLEEKLEHQLALQRETDADLVYCSYYMMGDSEKAFLVQETTDFDHALYKSMISCSTVLMSKEIADRYPFDDRFYHEDLALWLTILRDGWKASGCREVLAKYRIIAGSRSFNKLRSAYQRWRIYRDYLKLPLPQSWGAFFRYAVEGVRKYR